MMEQILATAAILATFIAIAVGDLKAYLPRDANGDRQAADVHLLAYVVGVALALGVLFFTHNSLNRQDLGVAIAAGLIGAMMAMGQYHGVGGVTALLATVRQVPVPPTPTAPAPAALTVVPAFQPIANDPLQKVG